MRRVFRAVRSGRGAQGQDYRRFLEAVYCCTVNNIRWRALPSKLGPWNTVWKRLCLLSQNGTWEAFLQTLAACNRTLGLIQMFGRTSIRAQGPAGGGSEIEGEDWKRCLRRWHGVEGVRSTRLVSTAATMSSPFAANHRFGEANLTSRLLGNGHVSGDQTA